MGDGNDLDNAGLSQFSFNTAVSNMDQTNGAADASFTLNGLALTSSSNEIENVIDGVSLTLLTTTTAPANVSIAGDRLGITAAVGAFVESYNNYVLVNNGLTGFDSLTGVSGALSGDFSARSIESTVRDSTTRRITGSGSFYDSLATVGITTNADGTLSLDSTRLSAALDDDKEGVVTLFAGSADDSVEGVAERLTATLSATWILTAC